MEEIELLRPWTNEEKELFFECKIEHLNIEEIHKKYGIAMTKKELNRDCRRLIKKFKNNEHLDQQRNLSKDFEKEFKKIYGADKEFKYINPKYVLAFYRINQCCLIYPFHTFGIHFEI